MVLAEVEFGSFRGLADGEYNSVAVGEMSELFPTIVISYLEQTNLTIFLVHYYKQW